MKRRGAFVILYLKNKFPMNSELRAATENQARDLAERQRWREAARELLRVAKAEPRDASRWLQIAQWQRQGGDVLAAAQTLETALKLNGRKRSKALDDRDSIALWLALAEAQLEAQNWSACLNSCEILLQLAPRHHFGLEVLATALLQSGDPAAAEKVMRELLLLSPFDPLHRLRLATLLQLQGKLGESAREFERVIDIHRSLPILGEAREALETLEQMQTQQILMLASERLDFRRQLETDLEGALESLGFYLSENGRESLQHMIWDGSFSEEIAPRLH
jgi:predicted Zn-dependent protease